MAALTEASLVADPAPNTNGSRPPSHVTGWLCNGTRSEQPMPAAAMRTGKAWTPPKENRARQHSIFLDVELWKTDGGRRVWSCPFLAAVWQLLRLGQLRVHGESPAQPVAVDLADLPDEWSQLPAVVKLEPRAAPFCAYRTFSVLDRRFLDVEHAVRTILSQVVIDASVVDQTVRRAAGEGHDLPLEITDRISYLFLGS
nr:SCO2522 family protein [Micromonospora sp. DSM 115978]